MVFFGVVFYSFKNSASNNFDQLMIDPVFDLSEFPKNEAAFELGRFLFYSPSLSKNENTSCATCHLQATGFAHVDHQVSHGTNGTFSNRNAPSLVNLIWKKHYMWDGRIDDLMSLSKTPILSPLEMDASFELIIPRLEKLYKSKEKFAKAFGDSIITEQRILKALTYFLIELNSFNSKYDKVIRNEFGVSFNGDEKKGLTIFRKQCTSCHSEPFFTNNTFEFNGLKYDVDYKDKGRMEITGRKEDSLKFSVPSLRNLSLSFPYMHDGRFETIEEVLEHYRTIEKSKNKKLNKIKLSKKDVYYLRSFLLTLTDTTFITNTRFGFPPNDL